MVANKCVVLQSQQASFSKHVNTKERVAGQNLLLAFILYASFCIHRMII